MPNETTNPILEQLNTSLTETLSFIKTSGSATVDFAKEQTPLYIQELLQYNFYTSLGCCIIGIIMILIAGGCVYKLCSLAKTNWLVPYRFNSRALYEYQIIPNPTKEDWEKCANPSDSNYCLRAPEITIVACAIFCILFIIVGNIVSWNNTEWFKIKVAPRVYMVEQIKKLIK